jgi:hypothetical protein
MEWATIKNGELLALAAQQFGVFVTVDRNLSFQQNLSASRSRSSFFEHAGTGSPISGHSSQPSSPHSTP